jgi:hypothetical protein
MGRNGSRQRGRRHAQHVAEVRARAHEQVLHDVAGRAPPREDAAVQHAKPALGQQDVGRAEDHHAGDERRIHGLAEQRRQAARHQKDERERVAQQRQ